MKFLFTALLSALISFSVHSAHALSRDTNTVELAIDHNHIQTLANKYYYYNFGNVRVHTSQWADIYLRNTGSDYLNVQGVFVTGNAFWAWSNCPNYLAPGASCLARVEFQPWYEGSFNGRLRFKFPGGNVYVDLYGYGRNY